MIQNIHLREKAGNKVSGSVYPGKKRIWKQGIENSRYEENRKSNYELM